MDSFSPTPLPFSSVAAQPRPQSTARVFLGSFIYLFSGFLLILLIRIHPNFSFLLPLAALGALYRRFALQIGLIAFMLALTVSNNLFFERTLLFVTAVRLSYGFLALGNLVLMLQQKPPQPFKSLKLLFTYLLVAIISSLVGWNPLISFMKIFLFSVFQIALLGTGTFLAVSRIPVEKIRSISFMLILYFVFGSLALIPFPNIGHSMILGRWSHLDAEALMDRSIVLFNGVTWHSQTLGPLLAIINAYIFSELLRKPGQYQKFYIASLTAIPALIFYTNSRTGFLSYMISLISAFVWQGFIRNRNWVEEKQRRGILIIFLLLGPIYLFSLGGITQMQVLLRKGGGENLTVTEALQQSRMRLAELSLENFRKSPLFGNGFQVAENMRTFGYHDIGLAVSAPIEKGVLPTMVLEEGGIIGFAVFAIFILSVLKSALHFGCLRFLATFTTFIALNTGEATFFSVSGAGGLYWTICILALVIDWKEQQIYITKPSC